MSDSISGDKANGTAGAATALATIINALEPLPAEERDRTLNAAMVFYGIAKAPAQNQKAAADHGRDDEGEEDAHGYSPRIRQWMKQFGISAPEFDRTFQFHEDGSFDVHDAPGKSKREQTLNAYVLMGLGKFLATGQRTFEDGPARQLCEEIGCYDQANHATHIKSKGPEFSGDKSRGYTLSNIGMKRGAALIKELADEALG